MKKLVLIITTFLLTSLTYGQIIKIQGGISSSTIDWGYFDPSYENSLLGYSVFAGIDYLDKQYFNLSSNVGFVRKGGKVEVLIVDDFGEYNGEIKTEKPTLDYLSLNTLFELKYNIKEIISPFISFGPRFDYLVKNSLFFDNLEENIELKSLSIGMLLGGGIKHDLSKFQLGIRCDYYLNFNNIADWKVWTSNGTREITNNTITVNLTIGYKLK